MWLKAARSAILALRVNILRSALTMFGIVIGVGAVVAMIAVGAGAQARLAEQIQSLGSNLIVVRSSSTNIGGVRGGQGTRPTLTEDDAYAIQREIGTVQAAAPRIGSSFQAVYGNRNWGTSVFGITPEWFEVKEWSVVDGRAITLEDHDTAAKVVVVGQTVLRHLFDDENPVGETIRISRVPFTIVGVLEPKGQTPWGSDQDDLLLVPLSTARQKLLGKIRGQGRAIESMLLKIQDGVDLAEAAAQIRELLRQRHHLQHDQDDDFDLPNSVDVFQTQEEASRVMTYLLAAIASVSLFVGGVGIMNIMLVCVTERTREIGLRVAVGARSRDILAQFLVEALALSLLGGVLGVVAGVGGARAITYLAGWQTLIALDAIAVAFGVAAIVGIVFGFYPARRAARLDPIQALRYE